MSESEKVRTFASVFQKSRLADSIDTPVQESLQHTNLGMTGR
jgi:hypothetical protein